MNMQEAMLEIKKNPKMAFTHPRWYHWQYIYYKKSKYYQENSVEFDDERQGAESLACQHTFNQYSVKLKSDYKK